MRKKFKVGQEVTFKGRIGNFYTNVRPEETKGIIRKVEKNAVDIYILNNQLLGTEHNWTFLSEEFHTIVKVTIMLKVIECVKSFFKKITKN